MLIVLLLSFSSLSRLMILLSGFPPSPPPPPPSDIFVFLWSWCGVVYEENDFEQSFHEVIE